MPAVSTTPTPANLPDAAPVVQAALSKCATVDRTDAMLRMMALGMSLDEIEQQLDWLDARARLKQG